MYEQLENVFHALGQAFGYEWLTAIPIAAWIVTVVVMVRRTTPY